MIEILPKIKSLTPDYAQLNGMIGDLMNTI